MSHSNLGTVLFLLGTSPNYIVAVKRAFVSGAPELTMPTRALAVFAVNRTVPRCLLWHLLSVKLH